MKNLPLSYHDMLLQQLAFEDQVLSYEERITLIKGEKHGVIHHTDMPDDNDMSKWSLIALFVFGRNIIKREFRRAIA